MHDTAIQPYIGLKLALSAARKKAATDNPLVEDLDKLTTMATQVIDDLRCYASTFQTDSKPSKPVLLQTSLLEQAAKMKEFCGIDIAINIEDMPAINDRLNGLLFWAAGPWSSRRQTGARSYTLKYPFNRHR
jgi:hypothetical protein